LIAINKKRRPVARLPPNDVTRWIIKDLLAR